MSIKLEMFCKVEPDIETMCTNYPDIGAVLCKNEPDIETKLCKNEPDIFCYMCGKFATKNKRRHFTIYYQIKYKKYFKINVENIDQYWIPSSICDNCRNILKKSSSSKSQIHKKILQPMLWRETFSHESDCYFCLSTKNGFGKNLQWSYPTISAGGFTLPVLNQDRKSLLENPYYIPYSNSLSPSQPSSSSMCSTSDDLRPKLYNQLELNDLIRDLELTKEKSELLASRLRERNLLENDVTIS